MLVGWLGAEGIKLNVKKLLITVLAKVSMPLASYSFVMCLLLLTFFSIFSLLWYLLGCHVNFNSLSKIVFASSVTTGKGYWEWVLSVTRAAFFFFFPTSDPIRKQCYFYIEIYGGQTASQSSKEKWLTKVKSSSCIFPLWLFKRCWDERAHEVPLFVCERHLLAEGRVYSSIVLVCSSVKGCD